MKLMVCSYCYGVMTPLTGSYKQGGMFMFVPSCLPQCVGTRPRGTTILLEL